jgi:hypothetical protein
VSQVFGLEQLARIDPENDLPGEVRQRFVLHVAGDGWEYLDCPAVTQDG